MRVLVVEDDRSILQLIKTVFEEEGFVVDIADAGDEGLFLAQQGIYDLIILDIMLPQMDGLTIIQNLRNQGIASPILLLTAKDSVEDRVKGLDVGGDDYLVKPFAIPELLARARALLRRQGTFGNGGVIEYGPITLKTKEFTAYFQGIPLELTTKEYELLEYLLWNKEQIITREQIYDRVWGYDSETSYGIVDLYVHYLRKKMTAAGENLIHTIRGVGYMLKEK